MPTTASLNALQPEGVPHGVDIQIAARVGSTGSFFIVGEIYEMDYTEEQGIVKLPVLGSRRVGVRQGRYTVTGNLKSYWINASVREMLLGVVPDGVGNLTPIYHSLRPFQRFDIQVTAKITGAPVITFVNVVFSKDMTKWTEQTFTEETIGFDAEDILGQ